MMTETELQVIDPWPDEGEWYQIDIYDVKGDMLGWSEASGSGFDTTRFEGEMGVALHDWVQTEAEVRELFPTAYECEVVR